MSDYANLRFESETISQISKSNLETLKTLSHHIQSFQEQGVVFINQTTKEIEAYIKINKKENSSSPSPSPSATITSLQGLYSSYQSIAFKAKEYLEIMKDTVINPIDLFYKNQSNVYTDVLDEMHSMTMEIMNLKEKMDDVKLQYTASSIAAFEHEKNLQLTFTGKQANTINELNNANDKFLQAKSKTYALESQYKNEIQKFNIELTLYNKKYMYLISKMEKNEEHRILFLKDIMNKYSKYNQELSSIQKALSETIKKLSDNISIEDEMKNYKKEFNFSLFGERFKAEEFIPYKCSNEGNQIEDTFSLKSSSSSEELSVETKEAPFIFEINSYSNNPMDAFILSIFGSEEIEIQSMSQVLETIYNNQQSSKLFIDSILSKKSKNFWIAENLINLQHFANILNAISLNFENASDYLYDITFAIIFIAERTYFYSKKETVYLCSLLSQNKFYTNKSFWIEMIEFKLTRKLEEHVKHLLLIDIVPPKEEKKDLLQYFGSGLKGIKSVFGKESTPSSGTSLLESLKMHKIISNYKKLPEYKKPYLDSFATKEIHLIIKEFIPHLCNFNFGITEVIDMVVELSTKYKVPMERMNYYVSNIGSWCYTIKKRLPGMFKVEAMVDKIKMIKEKRLNLIQAKYPIAKAINEATMENKMKIIVEVAKYFKMNELGSIFILCKSIHSKSRIKIFKEMLRREELSLEARIKIWYCLLNITEVKKKYTYGSIVKEIEEKTEEAAIPANILAVIKLDVLRTSFASNVQESKRALASILKCVAYIKPKLNYCQGMNYIASFLYQLINNEEETFYVMMGLVDYTDFAMIFMEDLQKLKVFFYIFERLLNIFLPDISYTFKLSSVNVNYFCPPWFLTLFTNTTVIVDLKSPPKVVLKIWDEFFLKGWKALIIAGLSIISHNQRKLLSLKYDEVLHFLINDVLKSNFFKNSFFENYLLLISQLKLSKKLITNLETEYQYELKEKAKKH